jgi:hypothetical protein
MYAIPGGISAAPSDAADAAAPRGTIAFLAAALLMAAICLLDLATPPAFSPAALYAVAIFIAGSGRPPATAWRWAATGTALTIGVMLRLARAHPSDAAISNAGVAVLLILVTAGIVGHGRRWRRGSAAAVEPVALPLSMMIAHEMKQPLAAIHSFADAGERWLRHDRPNLDQARLCRHRRGRTPCRQRGRSPSRHGRWGPGRVPPGAAAQRGGGRRAAGGPE